MCDTTSEGEKSLLGLIIKKKKKNNKIKYILSRGGGKSSKI